VRQIHGIRPETANLYFSAVRHESRSLQACVVRIGAPDTVGSLTRSTGTHQSTFARDCSAFVDVWSATGRPPEVRLHTVDGDDEGRLLYSAPAAGLLDAYTLGRVESHAVRARDGHVLGAMMIKPPDFDPNRKYPVLCYVYGGPGTPVVRDAWGGATFLWHHMIAARGAIVWLLDNRSASGADARSAWAAHVDRGEGFGPTELRDVEDGLDWLATQRYVDPERIGIWGWSFGGYLTAYAMTHTKRFRVGVAGAAVTDWSLYDTVYTERYLGVLRGVPGRSQEAYRQSSVIGAAPNLHGKLLIVHGTADDNVHAENSIRLVDALQQAGRDFELMLYPGAQHAIEDERQLYDLRRRMTAFLVDNL
jgi:dipeptidyl-peptidase-4